MEDKLQVLENVPLLASLGPELLKSLADTSELVAVRKGELVVREHDPGDALFAVISGRLQAFTTPNGKREHIFATYCNGDYFGEMPLLSGESHWANVRAINDSVVLKIPRDDFDLVIQRDPRVAVSFGQRMGRRIKELRKQQRVRWSTIIALYSAVPSVGKTTFATNLVAALAQETRESVLLLDMSGRRQGIPLSNCENFDITSWQVLVESLTHTPQKYDRLTFELSGDEREISRIAPLFGAVVRKYDYVLVDLPNQISSSILSCLMQADQIYLVARNDDESLYKTKLLLQDLRSHPQSVAPKAKVILTGADRSAAPYREEAGNRVGQDIGYYLRWIPEADVGSVDAVPYALRKPMEPYSLVVRRIARELGNVLVGLALGSGAARGFAHIGVIRVLEREGIAVDMVSGSSMGALIAAAWAVGKSADEMEEIALRIKGKRAFLKLLDPMFPGAGIIRGMRIYRFLQSIVGDLTFKDTVIPVRLVGADLNTTEEVIFENGKLVDAVRASIAIPGVFRPVISNGHVLIDGGIANPVPVSVLSHLGVAKIIAVNTIPNAEEMKLRDRYRSQLLQASRRKRRGGIRETGPLVDTPTSLINVYMRSMHAMQSRMAEDACTDADVVVRPNVRDSSWYDFYHPERYIRSGEEAAQAVLPRLKELIST